MLCKVSRLIVSASFLALLAGCNSLGIGGDSKPAAPAAQPNVTAQICGQAPWTTGATVPCA
ncbi:hypothetical protein ACC741_38050, partial [Rhizobium johnstonii]